MQVGQFSTHCVPGKAKHCFEPAQRGLRARSCGGLRARASASCRKCRRIQIVPKKVLLHWSQRQSTVGHSDAEQAVPFQSISYLSDLRHCLCWYLNIWSFSPKSWFSKVSREQQCTWREPGVLTRGLNCLSHSSTDLIDHWTNIRFLASDHWKEYKMERVRSRPSSRCVQCAMYDRLSCQSDTMIVANAPRMNVQNGDRGNPLFSLLW
jgi:hypothetical protein